MKKMIEAIMYNYGFGMNVEEAATRVYCELHRYGYDVCIVNGRYVEVEGQSFQLRKTRSKGHWTVREF